MGTAQAIWNLTKQALHSQRSWLIVIAGILSSLSIDRHMIQDNLSSQNEAVSIIAQIQTTIASYADKFGTWPTNWTERNVTSEAKTD